MQADPARCIQFRIGMMHAMEAPESRNLVHRHMQYVGGKVCQEYPYHNRKWCGPQHTMQQAELIRLRPGDGIAVKPPAKAANNVAIAIMPRLRSRCRPLPALCLKYGRHVSSVMKNDKPAMMITGVRLFNVSRTSFIVGLRVWKWKEIPPSSA
jgi:hypothetical protein